ncbi:hypothetical protein scyTo_0016945 [Scyliorhinus torazame]|uniref:Uncharacterized protein n=1 Tax=Scyliorhinus torazame TaxID=75743 RepID=A0A401Q1Z8_SCYTO|nr:hypothetical protein [Scyliorhinus torazame]
MTIRMRMKWMNLKKMILLLYNFIYKGLRKQKPLQNKSKCKNLTQEHCTTYEKDSFPYQKFLFCQFILKEG